MNLNLSCLLRVGVAALSFALLLPQSAHGQQKRFDGVTLTVATFAGVWRDAIKQVAGAKFEALGGKIVWTPGSTTEFLQQAIAARGGYVFDIVEVTDDLWPKWQQGGFVQKWDRSKIPNLAQLDAKMYDDYRISHWIVLQSIIYNVDKFRDNGIPAPTKYSDLINPKLKKKVVTRDFTNFTGIYPVVALAHEFGGSEANIMPGLEKLKAMDVLAFLGYSGQGPQLMESGAAWVALMHAGYAIQMLKAGLPVGVVHPVVDGKRGLPSLGYLALGKASPRKNREAAHWFMNELIGEEQQEKWYQVQGSIPTNKATLKKILSEKPILGADGKPVLILDPDELANAYYLDFSHYNQRQWNDEFNKVFFGK